VQGRLTSLASQICAFPSFHHNVARHYRVSVPRLSDGGGTQEHPHQKEPHVTKVPTKVPTKEYWCTGRTMSSNPVLSVLTDCVLPALFHARACSGILRASAARKTGASRTQSHINRLYSEVHKSPNFSRPHRLQKSWHVRKCPRPERLACPTSFPILAGITGTVTVQQNALAYQ